MERPYGEQSSARKVRVPALVAVKLTLVDEQFFNLVLQLELHERIEELQVKYCIAYEDYEEDALDLFSSDCQYIEDVCFTFDQFVLVCYVVGHTIYQTRYAEDKSTFVGSESVLGD